MPTTAASIDLCTLDQAKTQLKLDENDDTEDDLVRSLIDCASLRVEQYCGRKFKLQTYTNEVYDGTGESELYLRNAPVDPNTAVTVDFRVSSAWQSQDVTYLRYDDPDEIGLVFWEIGAFSRGRYNVRVTYKAGFAATTAALPPTLRQATVEWVEVLYQRIKNKMHLQPAQQIVDGVSITFRDSPIPTSVRDLLKAYVLPSQDR
jgi:uncharacterized phiE125 gp8 family phage protein